MSPGPSNLAASIRQRLLNLAQKNGEDFQQLTNCRALAGEKPCSARSFARGPA